ncbi:MAG: Rieske (2Fe-2S) protein [Phycisphaerae bacterium]|nr:Rieske (2Fe-2S) protein [Phycisphaerae bacterium]
MSETVAETSSDTRQNRRSIVLWGLAAVGVVAGYGTGLWHFMKYLVPLGDKVRYREMFVGPVDALQVGQSRLVRTPAGETFLMARTEDGFRVLSDICPHLGCRVHWEPQTKQFICPCHMGIFDEEGLAISGPPAEAGQRLVALDTVVRGGSVFVLIKEA